MNREKNKRESGIELFRIVTMLLIVASHYVANSGLLDLIDMEKSLSFKNLFYLIFGWGGKTCINCFVLITGYFMCKSKITLKKFLKLVLMIELYKVIFYFVFLALGYETFSISRIVKVILPINSIAHGFASAYLAFFLFIPFLNVLVNNMNEKMHLGLIGLCVLIYTVLPSLLFNVEYNYVTWFCVIYFVGAYIRLYPKKIFSNKKACLGALIVSLLLSWLSVIACEWIMLKTGENTRHFFIADSNKILALITAVTGFLYFKNLDISSNFINRVAASTFGVLLIHANSDAMRQWLWVDMLKNVKVYETSYYIIHAVVCVLSVYCICTVIDMLRIKFLETPFFKWYDKKHEAIRRENK